MYSYNPYYENYLSHHGIQGQKWGVRRYQPYPSGSKRKGRYLGKEDIDKRRAIQSGNAKEIKKHMNRMSTNELRDATERARLKSNLDDLEDQQNKIKRGARSIQNALKTTTAIAASGFLIANGLKRLNNVADKSWQKVLFSTDRMDKAGFEKAKKKVIADVIEEGAKVFKPGKKKK